MSSVEPTLSPGRAWVQHARRAGATCPMTAVVVFLIAGLTGLVAVPGADSLWLVAFGNYVAHGHLTATSVPYATASEHAWANVPVLAELAFAGLDRLGGIGALLLAQAVAVALSLGLLARTMRREGGEDVSIAVALVVVVVGSVPTLVAVRGQLFSLVLFPVWLALLFAESRSPSRRVWLLVPLTAIWSMLHGAVLVGVAIACAWVVFHRFRRTPVEAATLIPAMLLALCATPALARTPRYYADVLGGEVVKRHYGLWAPFTWSVWDVLLLVAAGVLGALAVRARPAFWVAIAGLGLAVSTARTPRNGVWLLMLLAIPAGRAGLRSRRRIGSMLPLAAALVACAVAGLGISASADRLNADHALIARVVAAGSTRPVLADGVLSEKVAAAGGRVWMADPIEAFSNRAQGEWIDWLRHPERLPSDLRGRRPLVLVWNRSPVGRRIVRLNHYHRLLSAGESSLYEWVATGCATGRRGCGARAPRSGSR